MFGSGPEDGLAALREHWRETDQVEQRMAVLLARVAELEAALAVAQEALKPFAAEYEVWDAAGVDDSEVPLVQAGTDDEPDYARFSVGDLRRAKDALCAPALQSATKLDRLRREVCAMAQQEPGLPEEFRELLAALRAAEEGR
jgi:hypothetical protein